MNDLDARIKPGMSATVRIAVARLRNVLVVPAAGGVARERPADRLRADLGRLRCAAGGDPETRARAGGAGVRRGAGRAPGAGQSQREAGWRAVARRVRSGYEGQTSPVGRGGGGRDRRPGRGGVRDQVQPDRDEARAHRARHARRPQARRLGGGGIPGVPSRLPGGADGRRRPAPDHARRHRDGGEDRRRGDGVRSGPAAVSRWIRRSPRWPRPSRRSSGAEPTSRRGPRRTRSTLLNARYRVRRAELDCRTPQQLISAERIQEAPAHARGNEASPRADRARRRREPEQRAGGAGRRRRGAEQVAPQRRPGPPDHREPGGAVAD